MAYLVLVRHTESTWNNIHAWTGLTDISLSKEGREKAKKSGEFLKDILFDVSFTSILRRARETLIEIKTVIGRENLPVREDAALNERDYGDLTGRNKLEMEREYGEEQYLKWRRSWDYPVPNGESLKDVYSRVIPYYEKEILPYLKSGKNVLVVAHGNSLRALMKYLENISDEDIAKLELKFGGIYIFEVSKNGKILNKQTRNI